MAQVPDYPELTSLVAGDTTYIARPSEGATGSHSFDLGAAFIAVQGDIDDGIAGETARATGVENDLDTRLTATESDVSLLQGSVTSGRRQYATYASAVSDAATPVLYAAVTLGQVAEVPLTDAGTHTDPVVGGTVNNSGIFRWSVSPAGWQRISDVDAVAASGYAAAAAASAAEAADDVALFLDAKADLTSAIQKSPTSLQAGNAQSLAADRMLDPATFIDKIMGVDAVGRGTRSFNPIASLAYIYAANPAADLTVLFRAGQQHMITPPSDGSGFNIGAAKRMNVASFGPEGNYGACLDTRMPLAGQTWTASGGGWSTTVTMRNSLDFTTGANVAGVHLMLWNVPEPHDDVLGSLFELQIGNANPAANDTAVDATSDVDAWSIKYAGQTAGDIRGTAHVGDTYTLHIKMADGSNPNGQPLFLADYKTGMVLTFGSHGHVAIIGTTGKDSCSFTPKGSATLGLIPWFESITMLGVGGHGGVGPKCTVGEFRAVGVPIPGEVTFPQGRTGGGGCHNFSAGYDFSNQYLYNGSLWIENFTIALYAHGLGAGESYRGWNVGGDIVSINNTEDIELQITLVEGFKHAGRLISINSNQCVLSYPGQNYQLAGQGGQFKPGNVQAKLATFAGGGVRTTTIGSDNPEEIFVLDAGLVSAASPNFNIPILYERSLSDSDPAPSLILKHVEDRTVTSTYIRKFCIADVGFNPNGPYVELTLIGSKLGDLWPFSDFAPHWPSALYVDGTSEVGFFGRTWAEIETAMGALGNPCVIQTGARAMDAAGNVVDTK